MSGSQTENTAVAVPPARAPQPTFRGALRGLWLMTWRANLTLGRLPITLLPLLVLPVLVFLTTPSVNKWSKRNTLMGRPSHQVQDVGETLQGTGVELSEDQRTALGRVFEEEFARVEQDLRDARPGQNSVRRQREQIRDAYDRIYDRSRKVLREDQYAAYRQYESAAVQKSQGRVREALWSRTEPFYRWLIDFYFFVMLPLNCIRGSGGLIRDEVLANTLGFLVTRPISRARLLLAKFVAQVGWYQIILLLQTVLLFLVGWLKEVPEVLKLLPLLLGAQVLAVLVWSALGTVLGQLTKRYMAAGLLYGLVVEIGIGQIPTNINNLSLVRQFKSLLSQDAALQSIFNWTAKGAPTSLSVIALATFVFLVAAALLFTYREYHHTVEMQK